MQKILFCNLDLLKKSFNNFDNSTLEKTRNQFLEYAEDLCSNDDNKICFISREQDQLNLAENFFISKGYKNFKFMTRHAAKEFVLKHKTKNNYFVFISGKEVDFRIAVLSKSLFIVPTWIPTEPKSEYYGVHVDNPEQLNKFIRTLNNQENWYAELEIEPDVFALSLMDARYKYKAQDENERNMIKHFEELLKDGTSRNYYDILLYHFLAGMTNSNLFDDIELFGMIPSSDCQLNPDMFKFMTQVRYIKNKRLPKNNMSYPNLLIRRKAKVKAHMLPNQSERSSMGGIHEFNTLIINPEYKDKINRLKKEGKFNVVIFDDYMTHGNTFNSVRNILKHLGANKIIFVSLGNFGRPFQKIDYNISGDVYELGYSYAQTNVTTKYLTYNTDAKQEVSDLYEIFNS